MAFIGFSTGALKLGDFQEALRLMHDTSMTAVELSALRLSELPVLIDALPKLNLRQFSYVSVHSPSRFSAENENGVIELLRKVPSDWPIVLHPDTIYNPGKWSEFGTQLAIENMDRRKPTGRSAEELSGCFDKLPDARLVFDLAHAHQYDRTMTEAFRILVKFKDRICQLHISELDSAGHHFPLSYGSMHAFSEIAYLIPPGTPAIIESLNPLQSVGEEQQKAWMEREANRACEAIGRGEASVDATASSGRSSISPPPVTALI